MKYNEEHFKIDKEWYRFILNMLAEGGPDAVQQLFMESDEKKRDYLAYVTENIAEMTLGLHQALMVAGSKYCQVYLLNKLKENPEES
jgi:hypothetical protein